MYMTRQRAKSSFIVEIKRANKRAPEVTTVAKAILGNELLDRVFGLGTPSKRPARVERGGEARTGGPDLPPTTVGCPDRSAGVHPSERPATRVLPDLLVRDVDPVEQRMKQQVEERAARRRVIIESRRRSTPAACESEPHPEVTVAIRPLAITEPMITPVPEEPLISAKEVVMEPAGARTREKRKRNAGRAAMKARRADVPARFAAGERWKRRLPKACW